MTPHTSKPSKANKPKTTGVHVLRESGESGEVVREALSQVRVIDDFAPDFAALRRQALAAEYRPQGGAILETGLYSEYRADDETIARIGEHLGLPLEPADPRGTGRFSLRTARMRMGLDIHADACLIGAILYLNEAEHCEGGTSIFRHRETGLVSFPDAATQRALGLADDPRGYFRYFCEEEGMDRSKWDEIVRVDMRPNRLVILAGGLFHSHSSVFGNDLNDGRLVQLYFLNPRGDA